MNSSTSPLHRSKVLRGPDSEVVLIASPEELDLSDYATAGSETAITPEMAEHAKESGYKEGWAQGFEEAKRAADETFAIERRLWQEEQTRRLGSTLDALASAVVELQNRQALEIHNLEDHVADTAFALATALIGRELQLSESPGRDAVSRALALTPSDAALVIRCNPNDVETMEPLDDLLAGRQFRIVADSEVETGGCLIDTAECQVDALLSTATARMAEALFGNDQLDTRP